MSLGAGSNRTLIGGFSIILISVLALALLILNHLGDMDSARQTNTTLRIKTEAAFRMAEAIRNRNFSLAIAPTLDEYFDRDDEKQRFAAYARDFLIERDKLFAVGLNAAETAAFDEVTLKIGESQPVVEKAISEAVEQGNTTAVRDMVSAAWQIQTLALKKLDIFVQTINAEAAKNLDASDKAMQIKLQFAVALGAIVLILSAVTAVVVIRRDTQSRGALIEAADEIHELNERLKQENVRISAELGVAQKIQEMILPRESELTVITELDIAAYMEAADEVGGDYYDVLQCCEGHVLIGIGDVTGHGLESGVIMLMVQSLVRALMERNEPNLKESLITINQVIYRNAARMNTDKNLSLSIVHYFDGRIRVAGQHEELLIIRDGVIERIDTMDLGFPIGLEENIAPFVSEYETHLNKNDVVVLYTDGIVEAEDLDGELYGMDRMCDVIEKHWQDASSVLRTALVDDVNTFINDGKVHDDITLVVIKRE